MLEIIIVILVLAYLFPAIGVGIPEPLNRIIGIILGIVLIVWLLRFLGV